MKTRCDDCGQRLAPGGGGEAGAVACARCDRAVLPDDDDTIQGISPFAAMGRPPQTGQLFPRGRGGFPDKPQRVTLPQAGRPIGRALAPTAAGLDRRPGPLSGGGPPVTRQAVAETLARFDTQLGDDWPDRLGADDFSTLIARLERVRRVVAGGEVDEAITKVRAWQGHRVEALLAAFEGRVKADELEQADAVLQQVRQIADAPGPVDRATAALSRAWEARQSTEEGRLKLERARALAGPPHAPRKLKQALTLYEDLLRRLDRYVGLRPAFDLIKGERDEVDRLIKASAREESARSTAMAMREIDGLVSTRSDYLRAIEEGTLDEEYARERAAETERLIRETLTEKVEAYVHDAEELARNPRDAQVALDRVREHERLWGYLAAPVRARVEREVAALEAVIARREAVIERCAAAAALVEQGDYVSAIGQLAVQRELHRALQVDVERPLEVAVTALAQRVERRLTKLDGLLSERHVDAADLERAAAESAEIGAWVEPVASHAEALEVARERAEALERRARRLRGELVEFDDALARLRELLDRGDVQRARRLLDRVMPEAPAQRKGALAHLKEELDLALEDDEIESRLDMLALTEPAQATAWAQRHGDHPACRRYLLHTHASASLTEITRAEQAGAYEEALVAAARLAEQAPPSLADHIGSLRRRLERVIADRGEVQRRLVQLRGAEAAGRLGEMRAVFEGELAVGADLEAEWAALREAVSEASEAAHAEVIEAAVEVAAERRAAARTGWLCGDPLTAEGGISPDEAGAHVEAAFEALAAAGPAAAALGATPRSSAAATALAALGVERLLCEVEARIARRAFDDARVVLDDPLLRDEPRVGPIRARLERIEFGRRFGQAIEAGDLVAAEALIEGYGSETADEVRRAEQVRAVAASLASTVAEARGRAASADGALRVEVAEQMIARLIEAHRRAVQVTTELPPAAALLGGALAAWTAALEASVDAADTALRAHGLPGAEVALHALLDALAADVDVATFERRRASLGASLAAHGRAMLTELERSEVVDRLTPEQCVEVERRLVHLSTWLPDDDPQLTRCLRRVRASQIARTRRRDAARRHAELLRRAAATIDTEALEQACSMEREGEIEGDEARRLLAGWQRAEPIVAALREALGAHAFDRVEHLLDQLERTGSEAHIARLTLPDPFDPTRALPPGVSRLRELLPGFFDRAQAAIEEQRREVDALDEMLSRFEAAVCRVAADAPPTLDADPRYSAALDGAVRWASEQIEVLSRRIAAARHSVDDAATSGIRRLEGRLPPGDPEALRGFFDQRFRQYRTDHRFAMACSHAPMDVLWGERDRLLEVRTRWGALPELCRLLDDLLR